MHPQRRLSNVIELGICVLMFIHLNFKVLADKFNIISEYNPRFL
jgi:hypothetical protein